MKKYLNYIVGIAAALILLGGSYDLGTHTAVKGVNNGTTSTVSGGFWVQASNPKDMLSVGTSSPSDSTTFNGSGGAAIAIDGVITATTRISSVSGTTTPCAIQSPSATSTLIGFSFMPVVGTTTASTVTLATSTTAFATTSPIMTVASYTPNNQPITWEGGVNNTAVFPNSFVVIGMAASTATGGFVMTGVCTATFQTIN